MQFGADADIYMDKKWDEILIPCNVNLQVFILLFWVLSRNSEFLSWNSELKSRNSEFYLEILS